MGVIVRLANAAQRSLSTMFPGFFPTAKHDHYSDFGWSKTLSFQQLYDMYLRNSVAHAGVDKTIAKTWQDNPFLLEMERDGSEGSANEETKLEADIRKRFDRLRLWQALADADCRFMVGGYSGVILRLADGKTFDQPVDTVPGGLDGLVEVIPVWKGQLTVAQWDTDQTSLTYGEPMMFAFNEANVETGQSNHRAFNIHPSRVVIWSKDGTVHGRSALEAGFNDLMTMEKVSGAGGEGFWKNAKSAPVLEMDADAQLQLPPGMTQEQYADAMTEQVESWQSGFDKLLMLKGLEAKTLQVNLPSPEHFFGIALQSFAASLSIPVKILIGNQTGERASTEDAEDWAQTCQARRNNIVIPNILLLVERLVEFNILPEGKDWYVDWDALLNPGPNEVLERVERMANVNDKMKESGEFVFTPEEMRAETGREPLSDTEKYRDSTSEDEERAALGLPEGQDEIE